MVNMGTLWLTPHHQLIQKYGQVLSSFMTNLMSIQFSVHIYVVHSLQHTGYLAITTQKDEFEDIKGVICKSKDRQHAGQKKKDKQRSAKHYTEI